MKIVVAIVLSFVAVGAHAAQVYKCQDANGKVEYSDHPCATAGGTKVEVKPNSVGAIDESATHAKSEALDKRVKQSQAADQAENAQRAAVQQGRIDRCQGYRDEIARQRAWLVSQSEAVRKSAEAEIQIQRRRYTQASCDAVPVR